MSEVPLYSLTSHPESRLPDPTGARNVYTWKHHASVYTHNHTLCPILGFRGYRGTSLIKKRTPLGLCLAS